MYERVLVALDGSAAAEAVLPHVQALAAKFSSTVLILWVVPPAEQHVVGSSPGAGSTAGTLGGARDPALLAAAERQQLAAYLRRLTARLRRRGLDVHSEQREGLAAERIVQRAREWPADLIAMTTHGRGGLERLVLGSVAEAVLRQAPCPVLLVRVTEAAPGAQRPRGAARQRRARSARTDEP
jgi:nucleotide-binding universal stress UspA family protein